MYYKQNKQTMLKELRIGRVVWHSVAMLALITSAWGGFYTVEEGHIGIQKRFSEAQSQQTPGLHWKVPFVDSVEEMEVRTRKNVQEDINVATAEQLPARAVVSVNWTVNAAEAIDIYRQYGGLDQFESRILTPAINSAAKDAIAKFKAEDIIKNRGAVVNAMKDAIAVAMANYPIVINSVQLENIQFPKSFTNAIEAKQVALQEAIKEEHRLNQQKLVAQQAVQTAQAEADAVKLAAAAEAYRIATLAQAQAEANRIIAESLTDDLIEALRIEAWKAGGSQVPNIVAGDGGASFLLSVDSEDDGDAKVK